MTTRLEKELVQNIAIKDIDALRKLLTICDFLHKGANTFCGYSSADLPPDSKYDEAKQLIHASKDILRMSLIENTREKTSLQNDSLMYMDGIQSPANIPSIDTDVILMPKFDGCSIGLELTNVSDSSSPKFVITNAHTRGRDNLNGRRSCQNKTDLLNAVFGKDVDEMNERIIPMSIAMDIKDESLVGNTNPVIRVNIPLENIDRIILRGELVSRDKNTLPEGVSTNIGLAAGTVNADVPQNISFVRFNVFEVARIFLKTPIKIHCNHAGGCGPCKEVNNHSPTSSPPILRSNHADEHLLERSETEVDRSDQSLGQSLDPSSPSPLPQSLGESLPASLHGECANVPFPSLQPLSSSIIPSQNSAVILLKRLGLIHYSVIKVKRIGPGFQMEKVFERFSSQCSEPLDGVVYCPSSWTYPLIMEETSKRVNYGKYKWKPHQNARQTKILSIEYTIGKTRRIVPTVHFDPVSFNGKKYSKSKTTITHLSEFGDIFVGSICDVELKQDISPYITKVYPMVFTPHSCSDHDGQGCGCMSEANERSESSEVNHGEQGCGSTSPSHSHPTSEANGHSNHGGESSPTSLHGECGSTSEANHGDQSLIECKYLHERSESCGGLLPLRIPQTCPWCGSQLEYTKTGKDIICTNDYCQGINVERCVDFLKQIGCKGISTKTLFSVSAYNGEGKTFVNLIEGKLTKTSFVNIMKDISVADFIISSSVMTKKKCEDWLMNNHISRDILMKDFLETDQVNMLKTNFFMTDLIESLQEYEW